MLPSNRVSRNEVRRNVRLTLYCLVAVVELPGHELAEDDVRLVGRGQHAVADDRGPARHQGNSFGSRLWTSAGPTPASGEAAPNGSK